MTSTVALHLQLLESNPGVLPVKEGQAYVQIDNWTIIKTINLDNIYIDLHFVISQFTEFKNLIALNKTFPHAFIGILMHAEHLRDITIDKYHQLIPQRFKRGILNPLGSLIKIVTGNLDHDDALKYDKITSEIIHDQVFVSKKVTVVSKMLDSFINTTELMYQNSLILDKRLKKLETSLQETIAKENNVAVSSYILGLYSLFISNFRTIFTKLSEVETALALSKSSILHQSIVNSTELLNHLKLIHTVGNLVYEPNESNLVRIEETISVKSYIKKNQITFIMEVPLTDNCTYNYYKMYSLPVFHEPVNQTLAIFPKYPYLLAKGTTYLPIATPCRPLAAGDQFLCNDDNKALSTGPTCEEQLLKFESNLTGCRQYPIYIEDIKVQKINDVNWILFTKLKTTLTKRCADEIFKYPVYGTYVITLDEPCDIEINGLKIRHHHVYTEMDVSTPLPIVNLPPLPTNASLSSARALNMHEINLDEVKYLSFVLKNSELFDSAKNKETDSSISALVYVALGLTILSFCIIVVYAFHLKIIKFLRNYRKSPKIEHSDNFSLGEGEVMHPPRPSALD